MKRLTYLLLLALLMPAAAMAQTHTLKWLRVNNLHHKVMNTGYQGESAGGRWGQHAYYYFDSFNRPNFVSRAFHLGVKNWTDPEGNLHPVRTGGAAIWSTSPRETVMPIELDAEGNTIKRYFRTPPPEVAVGDFILSEPFPLPGDEVAPDKIPGTADVMVESRFRLPMGIEVHQRVLGWTQKNHDDYLIFDWTFTNTGNIDLDDEVELPDQVLEDVYVMRGFDARPSGENVPWWSYYGAKMEDSLRIPYAYNEWQTDAAYDNFGRPSLSHGYIDRPVYVGEAFIHVDTSVDDETDNPAQPFMSGHNSMELNWFKTAQENASQDQYATLYQAMSEGFGPLFGSDVQTEGVYPDTRHMVPMDEWATARNLDTPQAVNYQWHPAYFVSFGPYTMEPGDDFRIVWATTMGSISPEKAWEVGQQWFNKDPNLTWDGPDNLPAPKDIVYPKINPEPWDIAKDHWVATGKDSLFQNASHAQWAVRNGYNVPTGPPAPTQFTVTPRPNEIVLSWDGTTSEQASDFAGYRIYRAAGNPGPIVRESTFMGSWERVAQIEGRGTTQWSDASAERGQAYYYYVTAYDDGSNAADANGKREVLESGKYLTMTSQPAHLTRAPGNALSDVRVVPNPFNRRAEAMQFVGEPDKLMFMNLPPECTIRIYSESGDLVKVLHHDDGSGDEPWGEISEEHSVTETGQVIVSGLYLAHIETPDGESTVVKFAVVR